MKIKQLPKEVYDLIAAGEVVLAPVSVVKELVENALDAGALRIIAEIAEGGTKKVRVSDNGSGIAREDIELSFMPHATSKLNSAEDLSHIETLGFRGEALASIAAVSSVSMVTKAEGESIGFRAETEGGSALKISSTGADRGTDITVEKLFFNIPARKKHMKGPRAEERRIIEYLSKAAVSRPDVAFRLISDGALVFATSGNGDRLASIASVYGARIAEKLLPVSASMPGLRIEGYISGLLGLRANRKGQHIFVNGRPVINAVPLESAISRAYREFAEPGRFPTVFLLLWIDPEKVDVNVHPAKNEISFVNAEEAGSFVEKSIRDILCSGSAIPRLHTRIRQGTDYTFRYETKTENDSERANDRIEETLVSTSGGDGDKIDMVDIKKLLIEEKSDLLRNKADKNNVSAEGSMVDHNGLQSDSYPAAGLTLSGLEIAEKTNGHYTETLDIQGLRVLATLFSTYMLATDGDAFYMIDQHAAHERVNFERFSKALRDGGIAMQGLLTPYLFTLPATLRDLQAYLGFFEKIGYEIDEFGDKTWAARSFPAFIAYEEGEAFLLETLEALGDEKGMDADVSAAAAERIMMRACKASIKANTVLSGEENTALLDALARCRNPYSCPHGRPVFLKLTRSDIERLFKRA